MAGQMQTDTSGGIHIPLVTSRTPKGPKTAGSAGSTGDTAFKDAVGIVIGAWIVLFILSYSLRTANI